MLGSKERNKEVTDEKEERQRKKDSSIRQEANHLFAGISIGGTRAESIVESQCPAIHLTALENLLRSSRALNVQEVSVRESTGTAGAAVNRHSNVNNVLNVLEQLVQILV